VTSELLWFGIASYGAAAVAYGAGAATLIVSYPTGSRRAVLLVVATGASGLWAAVTMVLLFGAAPSMLAITALDACHIFLWTLCITAWLAPAVTGFRLTALSAAAGSLAVFAAWPASPLGSSRWTTDAMLVATTLIGLLAVEQVLRNAKENQRRPLMLLCFAAGCVFTMDLFVYSQALLLEGPVSPFWEARGLASALLVPLIVVATKRQTEWETELFVSRQVVFYTASLLGVGGYLLAMGIVAYVLQALGGNWSVALEALFLLAAMGVLAFVLFSARVRGRFKVFLVKHFYRNKYDYREEWLRLTRMLGRAASVRDLSFNALDGLARIVGSEGGALWLSRGEDRYDWIVSLDGRRPELMSYSADHPIVVFLVSQGWVIDAEEYAREPDRYGTWFGDPRDHVLPAQTLVVPLDCQGFLQGFAILTRPTHLRSLNFEDHDILKTAGRQVAVVLAQALAQEQLAETRQFEATSKLTTFLMHDLKNIVAQQQLVVANAQKFRHRPEFIDDAIATVRSGAERMRRLLEQLQGAARSSSALGRVDVTKVLMEVKSHCADRKPVPETSAYTAPIFVSMDRDKLASVLTHVIRNAQDATPEDGRISVEMSRSNGELVIAVIDTGNGMDLEFVRDRLFRPFDTTKGAGGMGIGAYQVRETVRAVGGDVEVASESGVGTTFRLRIPLDEARMTKVEAPAA
jgi:putative PEP-CTERM system histidine kinase